ncbi:MAG: insulinase family protein [Armatimonadetes bacterium]|nr:insulinase family protein [Armatimonadota bacterium]
MVFDNNQVTTRRLSRGARVAVLTLPWARSVSIGAWVRSGTRDEPAELGGIAHFLEHMVFKGSRRYDTLGLARAFETLGGTMDAYTTHETTVYSVQVLPEHVGAGLELLSELLVYPTLSSDDIELEKQVVDEEIQESEDSPSDIVLEICARQAWGEHPLARPVLGTRATVGPLDEATLRTWQRGQYAGDRLLLAAAGAIEPEAFIDAAERAFGELPEQPAPLERRQPEFTPGLVVKREPADQIHLCLATRAPAAVDAERHALWVIDMLLGATMSSRLFQEVREKRGLAYQVSSSWQAQQDVGMLTIDAIASPAKVPELLEVVLAEAEAMAAAPLAEDDLAWVKEYARTTLRLGSESVSAQMSRLARGYFHEDRYVTLDETLTAIEELSGEEIQATAERLFGDRRWVLAAAGPVTPKRADRWGKVILP